jgi:hypothetical protein
LLRLKATSSREGQDEYTRWTGVAADRLQNYLRQVGGEAFLAFLEASDQFREIKAGGQ